MNQEKNRLAAQGIFWGYVNLAVKSILPFISRTIMIYTIGAEYIGLDSVFTSILQILSFAELGFGNVMVYSMYKPIAEQNTEKICSLLNLYKRLYRIIGCITIVVGVAFIPFLENFCSAEKPGNINIYILYVIYLINTSVSYLLFTYKESLLSAHQMYYVSSNINTITMICKNVAQMLILLLFHNYYVYVIVIPLSTILNNLGVAVTVKKIFPLYLPKGKVDRDTAKDIRKNVLAGLGHKLGPSATTSIDNLVVSSYLGLTMAAIYTNYNYILSLVSMISSQVFNSFVAGIGNSIITETREKNYEDFKRFTFINCLLAGWCTICLCCMSQNFMWIWVGNRRGANFVLDLRTTVIFGIMFYVQQIRAIVQVYKSAAGMWYADRWKPYISTVINCILDIALVGKIGITGILLSTIFARAAIGFPWETSVIFKEFFKQKQLPYYGTILKYTCVTVVIGIITYGVCFFLPNQNMVCLIFRGIICVIIPFCGYYLIYMKNSYMREVKKTVIGIFQKIKKVQGNR